MNDPYLRAMEITVDIMGSIAGVAALWGVASRVRNEKILKIAEYSFMIYVAHFPMVNIVNRLALNALKAGHFIIPNLSAYFLSTFLTMWLIVVFTDALGKVSPPAVKILSGTRLGT